MGTLGLPVFVYDPPERGHGVALAGAATVDAVDDVQVVDHDDRLTGRVDRYGRLPRLIPVAKVRNFVQNAITSATAYSSKRSYLLFALAMAIIGQVTTIGMYFANARALADICDVPELPEAAVVSVILGEPEVAVAAAAACLEAGVRVGCFRPPTVPANTSRLRLRAIRCCPLRLRRRRPSAGRGSGGWPEASRLCRAGCNPVRCESHRAVA